MVEILVLFCGIGSGEVISRVRLFTGPSIERGNICAGREAGVCFKL